MANLRLPVAPLNGGVSTQPYDNRLDNQTKTADNVILKLSRGLEKRPGSTHVAELDWANNAFNTNMFTHFFSYGDEDYVMLIDDDQAPNANKVQIFNLSDGTPCAVGGVGGSVVSYMNASASVTSRDKLKAITYGATTIVVNTLAVVSMQGTVSRTTDYVMTNLPVPPATTSSEFGGTAPFGGETIHLISGQVGYPVGYYSLDALSNGFTDGLSAPYDVDDLDGPWYTRLEANSSSNEFNPTNMPFKIVRTSANNFTVSVIDWNKRLSGDTNTNPPPFFVGEAIKDICIFQDRLWIGSETVIVSSQAGDLFNFWVDDYTNVTDADPITLTMPGPEANQVQWLVPLDDRILVFGSEATQYEITTRDIFSPSNTNLQTTTRYRSSSLVRPDLAGQQVVFVENRPTNASLWEYFYDFGSDSNLAIEASAQCQSYLPTNIFHLAGSQSDQMLFMAAKDTNDIYVYHYHWDVNQKLQSAFSRWRMYDYDDADCKIIGLHCVDNKLYVMHQRLDKVWLEYLTIQMPNIDSPLDFGVTLDSKINKTGVYDPNTNVTSFTVSEWDDADLAGIATHTGDGSTTDFSYASVLLSPDFTAAEQLEVYVGGVLQTTGYTVDTTNQQIDFATAPAAAAAISIRRNYDVWAGPYRIVLSAAGWGNNKSMTIAPDDIDTGAGSTVLKVDGDWSAAAVTIGILYEMSVELNQPIVKDQENHAVQGNFQIRTMEVRHQDTTSYEVEITPNNRDTKTFAYNSSRIGSARIGVFNRSTYGRYSVRVFGNSQDTAIVLKNTSPYPVLLTKLEYIGDFVPQRTNPLK